MKKNFFLIILSIIVIFCFVVLLKSLNSSSTFYPKEGLNKKLPSFSAKKLFNNKEINFDDLFFDNQIYLLNIWASWCAPCRDEHDILMELSKNSSIKIIGLNYKDSLINAKKFITEYGNPYSDILVDKNGIISIELGAYGVPETLILDKNKIILKKFIGPLNNESIKEIKFFLR